MSGGRGVLLQYIMPCIHYDGYWRYFRRNINASQSFSSQLTPHPHPLPLALGFSATRKLLPISSVAKSIVDPLSSDSEMASTRRLDGIIVG